jgi:hypothetical protein
MGAVVYDILEARREAEHLAGQIIDARFGSIKDKGLLSARKLPRNSKSALW